MGGVSKGISNIGHSASSLVKGKGNLRDFINVTPVGAAGQVVVGAAGMDGNKIMRSLSGGAGGGGNPSMAGGIENPATVLAQSGGAPLLANVAMGVDPKSAVASYFGASNYDEFYGQLNDSDKKLVDGVTSQLTQIQGNSEMKNKALQGIVQDFPNIAAQAAQAHQAAGGEFDAVTKDYLDKALGANAAKYAANGSISSGAQVAAAGRVGADLGMQKLNYMTNAGDTSYNQGVQGWQARYNEANALRNFQNLMTQGAAGQGFSATQSALNRNSTQNLQTQKLGYLDSQNSADNNAALFGTIGKIGGGVVGGYFGGPAGAAMGSDLGGSIGAYAGGQKRGNVL